MKMCFLFGSLRFVPCSRSRQKVISNYLRNSKCQKNANLQDWRVWATLKEKQVHHQKRSITKLTSNSWKKLWNKVSQKVLNEVYIVWILLKMSHLNFYFWHFPPNLSCLVTLFDRKLQIFKNSPKLAIFGIFNELLSTQNVNVARFARNVERDFFCDFQTPCTASLWLRTK